MALEKSMEWGGSASHSLSSESQSSERLDGVSNQDKGHIEANLEVIREYLMGQFKGFELIDTPDQPISHTFTVTKSSDERYHLKVSWPQLSDKSNTPNRTRQRLVTDDVAGRMKGKSQGESFWWGKYK